jgi:hypothetical protein
MRLCLALGVTPVFAPPLQHGFQAMIEHFNGLWQKKVWQRFHHPSLEALGTAARRFTQASQQRLARQRPKAPPRRPFPAAFTLRLAAPAARPAHRPAADGHPRENQTPGP